MKMQQEVVDSQALKMHPELQVGLPSIPKPLSLEGLDVGRALQSRTQDG